MSKVTNVLIVGGGFSGIRCALDLCALSLSETNITLINEHAHFDYHANLYKIVSGTNTREVCIPYSEIFRDKNINLIKDTVVEVNLKEQYCVSSSSDKFQYDYLVLALGSEAVFFNIPGLEKNSFTLKSISDAKKLNKHIQEVIHKSTSYKSKNLIPAAHLVVVGAGPSGVEVAGELGSYAKKLAIQHKLDPSVITVDIFERAPRLLPVFSEKTSVLVEKRLRGLGVNVFLNRELIKQDKNEIYLEDMELKTKTLIWTAGVKANSLYSSIEGLVLGRGGRVKVDSHLRASGHKNVFILGDGADTELSGTAQIAIQDGNYAAKAIKNLILKKPLPNYSPKPANYILPIGDNWAVVQLGNRVYSGYISWLYRRLFDLKVYKSLLPFRKALDVFVNGRSICDYCEICNEKKAEDIFKI